jgi:hypothetical protein
VDAFIRIDPRATDWRFSGPEIMAALIDRWPEAKVREIADQKRKASHSSSIQLPEFPAITSEGFVTRDGQEKVPGTFASYERTNTL